MYLGSKSFPTNWLIAKEIIRTSQLGPISFAQFHEKRKVYSSELNANESEIIPKKGFYPSQPTANLLVKWEPYIDSRRRLLNF